MNKYFTWVIIGAGVLMMGISMPSCPGQQAMQQQIDQLEKKESVTTKKLQVLETEIKRLGDELKQSKELLTGIGNTVLAQKTAIEQVQAAIVELKTKPVPAPKAGKKKGR